MVEQEPVDLAGEILVGHAARLGARNGVHRAVAGLVRQQVQRRPQRREPEMIGQMLDGDRAVADSALPIEEIVATAFQRQHVDRIAQTDGRRIEYGTFKT